MLCDCSHDEELFLSKHDSDADTMEVGRSIICDYSASQPSKDDFKQFWYERNLNESIIILKKIISSN